jgi:hypothetical protein
VGFVAITLTAVLSRWTLFSDAELAKPGFNVAGETVKWAFSGFASSTVWLVGGAFMLALGYQKTGLGRRIALCQRRSKNASACRRENASMMMARRPPNWGSFRQASGLGGIIRRRVRAGTG